jgi:hypothetical protein
VALRRRLAGHINFLARIIKQGCPATPHFTGMKRRTANIDIYGDLDIADGGGASAAFYQIVADPTLSPEARDGLRRSLLKYCQRDTLALARVHHWLSQGVTS